MPKYDKNGVITGDTIEGTVINNFRDYDPNGKVWRTCVDTVETDKFGTVTRKYVNGISTQKIRENRGPNHFGQSFIHGA